MMNHSLHVLEQLAERARMEDVPSVDVSWDVLRTIRQVNEPQEKVMLIFAVCSSAAASFAVGYCVYVYYLLTDPLSAFFQTMPGIVS